eukprot:m.291224 g.291224  ORF g.291224 m.291224 type:complete len:94 (+) comp15825_c2_seq5:269-550(+)
MQVAEEDDVAVAETPPYASAGKIGTISITPHLVWDATFGAPCLMFQAFKSTDTGKQDVTISDLGPMVSRHTAQRTSSLYMYNLALLHPLLHIL